jgi:uncharacterized protein (TIGR02266 family)
MTTRDEAAAIDERNRVEAALARLRPRLDALSESDLLSAPLQPRGVALAAMLVASTIKRGQLRGELTAFANAGAFDPEAIDLLPEAAHVVIHAMSHLGLQEELLDPVAQDALVLRARMLRVVQYNLDSNPAVEGKLDLIRRADVVELPRDLRMLAGLYADHFETLAIDHRLFSPKDEPLARVLALRIEEQTARLSELSGEWRDTLLRAWTLLAVYYADVTRAARYLFREAWVDLRFPEIDFIPRNLRTQPAWAKGAPPADRQVERVTLDPIRTVATQPAPTGNARAYRRVDVALHVSMGSESNFFMGLTENISEGGIFIPTHQLKPMGTKLTFALFLPGSDDPVCVEGVVRWVRNWSPAIDAAPGIGVQFEVLSDEDAKRVREFMDQRAPLFHDG